MKRHRVLTSLVVACIALPGCPGSYRRSGYVPQTQAAPDDCRVAFKQGYPVNPFDVDVLGTVTASHSWFWGDCDEAYVLGRMRDDACAIGADVVSLRDEKTPDVWSMCYRATADLLRLRDREAATTLTSDARYDAALLRERSQVTHDRLRGAIIGGAVGGAVGAAAAGAIVP